APLAGARVPRDARFTDAGGRVLALAAVLDGRPALLLPADFTCRTLCGPTLAVVSSALAETGLTPGTDYRLIVLGLDPKDTPEEGRALLDAQVADPALRAATVILRGDQRTIDGVTRALGYRAAYDAEHDQLAHPAAVLALTPDGHLARGLSSLALDGRDLRLALLEAGRGTVGGLAGRLAVLCYGFDAAHGIYTLAVTRLLKGAAALTVVALALALWRLGRYGRGSPDAPRAEGRGDQPEAARGRPA
ncbi:SCO family protein, partial [Methylobacterium sp.]|uniref:SCO family protein n=1 Tax=Methylobacterium sp. TaxID=409 RepID=UPI00258D3BD2